ncbi:hypothetical protein PAGU2638_11700 [Lysobacter sp. PAGU 2638]
MSCAKATSSSRDGIADSDNGPRWGVTANRGARGSRADGDAAATGDVGAAGGVVLREQPASATISAIDNGNPRMGEDARMRRPAASLTSCGWRDRR